MSEKPGGAKAVPIDTLTILVLDAKAVAALRISAVAGLLVEAGSAGEVTRDSLALSVQHPEVVTGRRVTIITERAQFCSLLACNQGDGNKYKYGLNSHADP